jgi:hypothetical protein
MNHVVRWLSVCAAVFLIILLIGLNLSASAQGDVTPITATPRPSPTNNGGSARWTIKSMTFQSNYPQGFDFSLEVTSTGGKIVEAGIVWQHTPSVRRRGRPTIDPSGKITASWHPGIDDAVPQWVGVDYWWTLKDEAGNVFETPHQYEEYADNTRKWHRAESEDVLVFWEDGLPDQIGPAVLEAMKKNRPIYFNAWGKLLNYRPRVIVYATDKPWSEWNPGSGTSAPGGVRTVGQTSSNWGGTVQLYIKQGGPDGLAYGTVLHEVDHLYQYFNGGVFSSECWFFEGDASYFEIYTDYDYLARVQDMAASGELPTLQNGGPSCRGSSARDAYDIGVAFWKWIEETYGPDAHRKIWGLVAQGKTPIQAIENFTGSRFVAAETEFRSWLGMSNPVPPTALPTQVFQFPPTPTYEGQ